MYNYIKGKLTLIGENYIVVENNDIGYTLLVSSHAVASLGALGGLVKVFTHLVVREDEMSLCGFYSTEERDMFHHLTSVSGIGAKVALTMLSGLSVSDIVSAITTGDLARLHTIKGVGKKTAERIVLELRDKIGSIGEQDLSSIISYPSSDEAIMALMSLGFTRQESTAKISSMDTKNLTTEQIITLALKGGR